jgi:hypothetical protein
VFRRDSLARTAKAVRLKSWVLAATASLPLLAALAVPGPRARAADVVPDYEFYKSNVAPIVEQVCAECHAHPR